MIIDSDEEDTNQAPAAPEGATYDFVAEETEVDDAA